jgi:Domain of unknown function (DUF4190)
MSDVSQGAGWWLASDGKWYPPQPIATQPPPPPPPIYSPAAAYGVPPIYSPPTAPQRPFSGMAVAAFVLAFLFWPLGIVLGHVARRKIRREGERGGGLALAALIISYIWGAVVILLIVVAVATNGTAGGPSQSLLQSKIGSDGPQFGVTGIASTSCVMPHSWTQGATFTCFAYNSSGKALATIGGTVLSSKGNEYQWNESWSRG